MKKTGKILISLFFIITIYLFGGTTLLKARPEIMDTLRGGSISDMPDEIEEAMTEDFKSRDNWINLNGLFQRAIGVTLIRDAGDIDVYRMKNGQLTYGYPDNDMEYAAAEVTSLDRFVRENGAEFIYVQLPCKAYSDELMPAGSHTYGYKDADELTQMLRENGVDVLDIRDEIANAGMDTSSLFFNTDHHWKPSTALWAAGVISEKLASKVAGYDYDRAFYDRNNYETTVYEDWFLGSLGRRTGIFFGGVDDFEVILPKFDTDYYLYTESQTNGSVKEREGSFPDALMSLGYLDKKDYFSETTYFTYMGTEYRLSTVTNRLAPNDRKILILRDSFSCTLEPYLSMSAAEVTAIDLRYYDTLQIKEYIKNNDFDAVMVVYNPSMFREEGAFDFDRQL